jgi:hypothetical protein
MSRINRQNRHTWQHLLPKCCQIHHRVIGLIRGRQPDLFLFSDLVLTVPHQHKFAFGLAEDFYSYREGHSSPQSPRGMTFACISSSDCSVRSMLPSDSFVIRMPFFRPYVASKSGPTSQVLMETHDFAGDFFEVRIDSPRRGAEILSNSTSCCRSSRNETRAGSVNS